MSTDLADLVAVFLVDGHEPTVRVLTERIDQAHDLTVGGVAHSIAEAVEHLNSGGSDIAGVASLLADGTALDFLDHLDAVGLDLPVIVFGAGATPSPSDALAAGAVAHAYKRIGDFNLLELIRIHATGRAA